jgi:hypothetical protein
MWKTLLIMAGKTFRSVLYPPQIILGIMNFKVVMTEVNLFNSVAN